MINHTKFTIVIRPFVWSSHFHKMGLQIRASSLVYLMHFLNLYHQLFIDIEREKISCVLDRVSFIELLATIKSLSSFKQKCKNLFMANY